MTNDDLREAIADLVTDAAAGGLKPDVMISLLCEMAGLLCATGKTTGDQLGLSKLARIEFKKALGKGLVALHRG